MSDYVINKKKNYAKEIEFIESKIQKSERELELKDPTHYTRKRRQELKNTITLGRARLKAIEIELAEEIENSKEREEFETLENSFKNLKMIPRTPLKTLLEDPTSPDVVPLQEPQDVDKLASGVPTSASMGITSTPSVGSTTTNTSKTDSVMTASLPKEQSTGTIPKTIFNVPTSVEDTGLPAYVPLYSNDGDRIKNNPHIKPPKLNFEKHQLIEKPFSFNEMTKKPTFAFQTEPIVPKKSKRVSFDPIPESSNEKNYPFTPNDSVELRHSQLKNQNNYNAIFDRSNWRSRDTHYPEEDSEETCLGGNDLPLGANELHHNN